MNSREKNWDLNYAMLDFLQTSEMHVGFELIYCGILNRNTFYIVFAKTAHKKVNLTVLFTITINHIEARNTERVCDDHDSLKT